MKKGFTLIELMVVVLIVGLLSGLVVVNVNNSRVAARDARRIADLGTISSALAAFYADTHDYPLTQAALSAAPFNTYLVRVPQDPGGTTPTGCVALGYLYSYSAGPNYRLASTLEAHRDGDVNVGSCHYYIIRNGEVSGTF